MNHLAAERAKTVLLIFGAALLLYVALACAALKRTTYVAIGTAAGGGIGLALAGPPGAVGGAALVAGATHAVVESQHANEQLQDATRPAGHVPPPPWYDRLLLPWEAWLAIVGYLWFRNRAHLGDAVKKRTTWIDAVLHAVGWRTHASAEKAAAKRRLA